MSFFDDIKSRFGAGRGSASEPYGDDQYDDYYGEDGDAGYEDYPAGYGQPAQDTYRGYEPSDSGNGMLGQTRRGEAESVAVYTRSGQLVGEADRHASSYGAPRQPAAMVPIARAPMTRPPVMPRRSRSAPR